MINLGESYLFKRLYLSPHASCPCADQAVREMFTISNCCISFLLTHVSNIASFTYVGFCVEYISNSNPWSLFYQVGVSKVFLSCLSQ